MRRDYILAWHLFQIRMCRSVKRVGRFSHVINRIVVIFAVVVVILSKLSSSEWANDTCRTSQSTQAPPSRRLRNRAKSNKMENNRPSVRQPLDWMILEYSYWDAVDTHLHHTQQTQTTEPGALAFAKGFPLIFWLQAIRLICLWTFSKVAFFFPLTQYSNSNLRTCQCVGVCCMGARFFSHAVAVHLLHLVSLLVASVCSHFVINTFPIQLCYGYYKPLLLLYYHSSGLFAVRRPSTPPPHFLQFRSW